MSLVVTCRPVGVRASTFARCSARSLQVAVSATMPGWIAFTRTGASSIASERIQVATAPFTDVTVVEPGYGRSFASPPKRRIEASSVKRSASWCTTSV